MRVALLCPGPSLGIYQNVMNGYATVIGVNQAVEAYSCDWWVFKDHNVFSDFGKGRKYGLVHPPKPTGIVTLGKIRHSFKEMDPVTEELTTLENDPDMVAWAKTVRLRNIGDWEFNGFKSHDMWKRFTVGSALMFAYQIGAEDIDCYGCDMAGTEDYRRREGRRPTDRDENRWKLETEMWDLIVGWLEERGITVKRIV